MTRRKAEFQALDPSTWPTIAWTEFDAAERKFIQARTKAIEQYASGATVREREQATGVNRRQLYRLLDRALTVHPDGRIYGFRALIAHTRIADYVRISPVTVSGEHGSRGAVGALAQLFERFPTLAAWLQLQIKQHRVALVEIRTGDDLRTRLRGLEGLHAGFLQQCRQCGLTVADYPFNTASHAVRSLSARVKAELLSGFGTAARAAGATHLKGLPRSDELAVPAATRPFQIVEFDGHRLDIRLKVVMHDPLGFTHEFEIERVWLLVIIDVCTRTVLGYHLVLAREYGRYDVIKTVEAALEPHKTRDFTIPELGYGPMDGFPSQRLPELAYVTWETIKLDNAKANLATDTLTALCEFVGCQVAAGRKHSPDERPYIERFFGTIASRLSSRMPGYTGGHPRDLRRALSDPKGNLRLFVSFDELEELIEYAIASYNGTPHSGLNNVSPLEAMEYFVRGKQALVNWLPEPRRRTLCLMQSAKRCRVRAYLDQGVRPHINLHGVRYTNPVLACSTGLIGKTLLVYLNADDLRSVRAFLPDGAELGVLDAQGAWRVVPHNLTLRQEIRKLQGRKRLRTSLDANAIETYIRGKFQQAGKTRRAASDLAQAARILVAAPVVRIPPGPVSAPTPALAPTSPVAPNATPRDTPTTRTRPRKLTIGTGQVG
ncbi:Integrase catalytic region [Burkholderia ambifaria IOP40-10]|uniref:Integrase catalytic region n=1 Tax=Burkholderia ambifaria IOP40-10 TaxID=396596 RepID=B1FRR6_9BURK|nr:DDE-type integrase/transposase/recombinase [Burkholderia ambifaria]EDS99755.1 Integrase catalytic region [Burkholderia ambifaria IOP40-10]